MAGLGQEASVLRGERDSKRHFKSSAHREGKSRVRGRLSDLCSQGEGGRNPPLCRKGVELSYADTKGHGEVYGVT